eukprot:2839844-Pyramimonas_sp.AAC.1
MVNHATGHSPEPDEQELSRYVREEWFSRIFRTFDRPDDARRSGMRWRRTTCLHRSVVIDDGPVTIATPWRWLCRPLPDGVSAIRTEIWFRPTPTASLAFRLQ